MITRLDRLQGRDIYENTALAKLNEVIDAVNKLQLAEDVMFNRIDMLNNAICDIRNHIADISKKVADRMIGCTTLDIPESYKTDPYAEQCKWIGTLCRCWDSDINDDIWGILQDIKDNKTEKYYLYGIGYEHCEPVKPDDDIIYKGE